MLKLLSKLQLPDQPFYTSASGDGRRFAACSRSGKCWLFDNDLRQLDELDLGAGVVWLQLDQSGGRLLVGFFSHIDVYTTTGHLARASKLDAPGTSGYCCVFQADEPVMCLASWHRKPILSAWDLASASVIAEAPLPDWVGGGYSLIGHPEGEAMAAVAFSGQSEEWMFWAHYAEGRLRVFEQPEVEGIAFPCFHPTGRELVSYWEYGGLCRVRFPSGEVIASIDHEEAFPDNPEDQFSYEVHFTKDDHILVWQTCLSLYEFDLATLKPIRPLLTGADGLKFGEDQFYSGQSWQLAGGRLLTSDSKRDRGFKNEVHTFRLWDASSLGLSEEPTPDPSRPYTKRLLAGGD